MKHTVATCAHLLATLQWTFIDAELDAGTELNAMAQRSDLGCAQREFGREDARCGEALHEARVGRTRHEAQGTRGARHEGRWVHLICLDGCSVESNTVIILSE
jgi:hypothetical protein